MCVSVYVCVCECLFSAQAAWPFYGSNTQLAFCACSTAITYEQAESLCSVSVRATPFSSHVYTMRLGKKQGSTPTHSPLFLTKLRVIMNMTPLTVP